AVHKDCYHIVPALALRALLKVDGYVLPWAVRYRQGVKETRLLVSRHMRASAGMAIVSITVDIFPLVRPVVAVLNQLAQLSAARVARQWLLVCFLDKGGPQGYRRRQLGVRHIQLAFP
ncbi:hypothetical protein GP486_008826, partial [Trichoglossum hirsutum]